MSDYINTKIKKGLIRYLDEVKDIFATDAYLSDTEYSSYGGGCDTCGYGGRESEFNFTIYFTNGDGRTSYVEIEGDPLNFFPILYEYMEK